MRVLRIALLAVGLGLLAVAFLPSGSAKMLGPCTATVAGQDLASVSSSDASQALVVKPDDVVSYAFAAPAPIVSHDAKARIGPYEIALAESAATGEETSATGTFDVSQVSGIAVGLYAVSAHASLEDGRTCSADFLLRIEGGVLDSPAGMASAAAAVLAGGGVVAVSVVTATGAKSVLLSIKLVV